MASDRDLLESAPVAGTPAAAELEEYYRQMGYSPLQARERARREVQELRAELPVAAPAAGSAPAEVILLVSPLLVLLCGFLTPLKSAAALVMLGVASACWGLLRWGRDRSLSRQVMASLLAPISAAGSLGAMFALTMLFVTLGLPPLPSVSGVLIGLPLLMLGSGVVQAGFAHRLARRHRGEARGFLYLQALPWVMSLAAGLSTVAPWLGMTWAAGTAAAWIAGAAHFVSGGREAPDRVGRGLRAWTSAGLLATIVLPFVFGAARPLSVVLWALTATVPLLAVDRSLAPGLPGSDRTNEPHAPPRSPGGDEPGSIEWVSAANPPGHRGC
jgi:hypothetical protein